MFVWEEMNIVVPFVFDWSVLNQGKLCLFP